MANNTDYLSNTYDYMDEASIDDELKCSICTQPFQSPVSLSCQHTFCQKCIDVWLEENQSCPTCREYPETDEDDDVIYTPINTHIVNNQLDRLLVRCNQCQQINLLRGNFREHEGKCLKRLVRCPSFDIECSWIGLKEQQTNHLEQCPFHRIRPIIICLRTQLEKSLEIQQEIRDQLDQQTDRLNYLFAYINKGNTMNKECLKPSNRCQFSLRNPCRTKINYLCKLCQEMVPRQQVVLHACSLNETIDCICQTCFDEQNTLVEESESNLDEEEHDNQLEQ